MSPELNAAGIDLDGKEYVFEPIGWEPVPQEYVTEIAAPGPDDGRMALYSPGLRGPELELEAG
jgi:hypothetical protein